MFVIVSCHGVRVSASADNSLTVAANDGLAVIGGNDLTE